MNTRPTLTLLVMVFLAALTAAGSDPSYWLNVDFDADTRQLEGTVTLTFIPETTTLYFSLLANLDAQENPYLAARQQDAVYPYGFEPSRITVLSVDHIANEPDGATAEALTFRLADMPSSWQTYSLEDTVLAVEVPNSLIGTQITIRSHFFTEAPRTTLGDQGITDGILTWRFGWFPMLFPNQLALVERDGVIGYEGRSSLPLVFPWAQLSALITVPSDYQLITGADHMEEIAPSDDSVAEDAPTRTFSVSNSSPSRSLALTIGQDYAAYQIESTSEVEVLYRPRHEGDARLIATLALDILSDYVERYGPYPRAKLTIVENPSPHGQAFAADGIVWLSARFFTHRDVLFPGALDRVTEYVLAHEIAHQWVGLGTGVDLDAEAWLSEGLAQYLSVRYFEQRYGESEPNVFGPQVPGVVGDLVDQQWGFLNLREHFVELPYLLSVRAGFDEELVKATENVRFGNAESVRLYDKGYLVARAMASLTGVDAFERALSRAIAERRADLLDVRSFQSLLEDASGQDLSAFFDYWVFGPGVADYAIRVLERSAENGVHTTVVAVSRSGGVPQPVTVEATMRSKGSIRQDWDGIEESAILTFTTPTLVSRVSVDPDHLIPDIDRLNNHAPAKIVGAASKNVLPLDAYVLAPDEETGGVIFSHLDRIRIAVSQGGASATLKLNRNHKLSLETSFASAQPSGKASYAYTTYAQPETGSAATYWEADLVISLTAQRVIDDGNPLVAWSVRLTELPSITDAGTHSVLFRAASSDAGQLEVAGRREWRLLPGAYIEARARLALSQGDVPSVFRFRASELRSISLPTSDHLGVLKLTLELPSPGAMPYSLLHLAMVDRVRGRFFATLGQGWTTPDELGTTSPSIEAGMEQIIELSTLGGLLSLTARIGVATPVLGEGFTTLYGNISF